MDIVLSRRGGVSVREQIVKQLEMKILEGSLRHGQRLPSVRALARRLKIHHNTVSAAYQDLVASGHVELQRGSGVYVRRAGPSTLPEARGLDDMIRLALQAAFRQGFTGEEIRAAVERWLEAAPPEHVLVVDPSAEMAALLVREIAEGLDVRSSSCSLEELTRDPRRAAGSLTVVLPYHLQAVRTLAPSVAVQVVNLEVSPDDRKAIERVPAGSIVLVVSHSPTVLPFASVFLRSLRGDEVVAETRLLADAREWKRLVKAADLVLADVLSAPAVQKAGAKRMRTVRVIPESAIARVRAALSVVVPRAAAAPTG